MTVLGEGLGSSPAQEPTIPAVDGGEGVPQRVRLSRAKGWRLPANTVVVSRPGPWGNPFTVTVDGTRAEVVRLHRLLLGGYVCLSAKADPDKQNAHLKHAVAHIGDLRGKNLACWCSLDGPCHADTLLEVANAPSVSPSGHEGRKAEVSSNLSAMERDT